MVAPVTIKSRIEITKLTLIKLRLFVNNFANKTTVATTKERITAPKPTFVPRQAIYGKS